MTARAFVVVVGMVSSAWSVAATDWQGFAPAKSVLATWNNAVFVGTADFDNDGNLDILVRNDVGDLNFVLIGDGLGGFTWGPVFLADLWSPARPALGDFNRDGKTDFVTGGLQGDPGLDRLGVVEFLGRGDGTFQQRNLWTGGGTDLDLVAADFDGDDIEDLAVNANGELLVFVGRGDGTFDAPLASASGIGFGFAPVVGDFTGDLVQDLLVPRSFDNLLAGDGTGGFDPYATVALGPVGEVIPADLEGDGDQDLVALRSDRRAVVILLGHGDGSFEPPVSYDVDTEVGDLRTDDFDLDATPDLAMALAYGLGIAVRLGFGDGSFMPEMRFDGGGAGLALGDFDGRNGPDAVTLLAGPYDGQVLIHQNLGPVGINNRPTAAATGATVECEGNNAGTATLSGLDSEDLDGDPLTYYWSAAGIVFDDPTSPTPTAVFPLGDTIVTLVVNDGYEDSDPATATVRVQDTIPPSIVAIAALPDVLWPPNHRMTIVDVALLASDVCDPAPISVLVSAASSEADDAQGAGDGFTTQDIQGAEPGAPDFSVLLRAERDGGGSGRSYTLTYRATDSGGNESDPVAAAVAVPHDLGGLVDPVMVTLWGSALTSISWEVVTGARHYDVVRGPLSELAISGSEIDLGAVVCIESGSFDTTNSGDEDAIVPVPGEAFFYLVQFHDGFEPSSYGSESAGRARVVRNGAGGCR